jgi:DNA-binding protein HU-beta
LKGAASPLSRVAPSSSNTALYAVKKATKKAATKKKASKKAAKAKSDVVNLKKADFVSAIAEKTGMTKTESDMALAAVLNVIATEVADGKRISLPGFGTFKLNFRAARKGRNPATGEEIDIKASFSPSFSASKTFKEMCNPDR